MNFAKNSNALSNQKIQGKQSSGMIEDELWRKGTWDQILTVLR